MELVIGLLTLVLVLDSLFLMLLILIQLPKKEAGAGLAFGAGTTDALFGAGSGTALSQITKYSAGVFLILAMSLSVMRTHHAKSSLRIIATELDRKSATTPTPTQSPATVPPPVSLPVLPVQSSNLVPGMPGQVQTGAAQVTPATLVTNAPALLPPATNSSGNTPQAPAPNQ